MRHVKTPCWFAVFVLAFLAWSPGDACAFTPLDDGTWKVESTQHVHLDRFGISIAMDGNLLLVGESNLGQSEPGQAYLYAWDGEDWIHQQAFSDSDAPEFGTSVDIADGYIAIGSPWDEESGFITGGVYVYIFDGQDWVLDGVVRPDPGTTSTGFGSAVSLDGVFLVVGEPFHHAPFEAAGRAQVWRLGAGGANSKLQDLQSDTNANGRMFGASIDIEGDQIVVGAPSNYFEGIKDGGRAYVFRNDGKYYEQELEFVPTGDVDHMDRFGQSVAIDTDRIAIGRPGKDTGLGPQAGSVTIYEYNAGAWVLEQEFASNQPGSAYDQFGMSVALDGDRCVVGVPGDAQQGIDGGSIFVFDVVEAEWIQVAKLVAQDGDVRDFLGASVALSNGRVAGGAPMEWPLETGEQGGVYIFDAEGGWQDLPDFSIVPTLASDAEIDSMEPRENAGFGYSVAHDGSWGIAAEMVEGDVGRVHFLKKSGGNWSDVQIDDLPFLEIKQNGPGMSVDIEGDWALVGLPSAGSGGSVGGYAVLFSLQSDNTWDYELLFNMGLEEDDGFGYSVDIDRANDRVVISAPGRGEFGSVFVFEENGGWSVEEVSPPMGDQSDIFGIGISLNGDYLAVGAPDTSEGTMGKAHVYQTDGFGWNHVETLVDPYQSEDAAFGVRVLLGDDASLLVSAPYSSHYGAVEGGAVYWYTHAGGNWLLADTLLPADTASSNWFGWGLDRDGAMIVVSEPLADDMGVTTGRAWLFELVQGQGWVRVAKLVSDAAIPGDGIGYDLSLDDATLMTNAFIGTNPLYAAGQIKVFDTPFMSFWTKPEGGEYGNAGAWIPEPPSRTRAAIFSLLHEDRYLLTLPPSIDVGEFRVELDYLTLVLEGSTHHIGSEFEPASVFIGAPANLRTSGMQLMNGGLVVEGDFTIGDEQNAGSLLIQSESFLDVIGNWSQSSLGVLYLDIEPGNSAQLTISETPVLDGTLSVLNWVEGYGLGTEIPLIASDLASGPLETQFDLVTLPGLEAGLCFRLHYEEAGRGGDVVWLEVIELNDLINFGEPDSYPITDLPSGVVTADLTGDGADEIAVCVEGQPGSLYVFINDGNGGFASQDIYTVGDDPIDVAAGDLEGDGWVDLAVTNFSDDSVIVLRNDGSGFGLLEPDEQPLSVGIGPKGIAASDLDHDGDAELIVCCSEDRAIEIYEAVAGGRAFAAPSQKVPTNGKPQDVDPEDVDKEKTASLGATTQDPDEIIVMSVQSDGHVSEPQGYPSGAGPGKLKSKDVDKDGKSDYVASNEDDGSVTILKQSSDRGFDPPLILPVAKRTGSLALLDVDSDGDTDIAIIAELDDGSIVLRLLRNDMNLYEDELLVFSNAEDLPVDLEPKLVASGDLDADGFDDLVAIGEIAHRARGDASASMEVHGNARCVGDGNGDMVVNVVDLLEVITQWGDCIGCSSDHDGNDTVNVIDLLEVISNWGSCE